MRESFIKALKAFAENGHVQSKLEPDYLIGELKTRGVITQQDADDILAKNSRLARQHELLLELVPKCDDSAFQILLDTMDTELYHWAREMLERMYEKEMIKKGKHGRLSQD